MNEPGARTVRIPTCPHCRKMMAGDVTVNYGIQLMRDLGAHSPNRIAWLCPENAEEMDPVWVKVEGIDAHA